MKKFLIAGFVLTTIIVSAQEKPRLNDSVGQALSEQVAATVMTTWKDSFSLGSQAKWSYDMGVILKGFEGIWRNTGDEKYYNYILKQMDFLVQHHGTNKTYKPDE